MLARDRVFVGPDEPAVTHDFVAADVEPIDAMRRREDQSCELISGAGELEDVRTPDRDVGSPSCLERADVVPPQDLGATARRQPKRLADGHCSWPAAPSRDEQRLLDFEEEVAALVRGGAVNTEPDAGSGIEQVSDRRDSGSEPQVRGRAVGDPCARVGEAPHLLLGEMDAVRAPDVLRKPPELLEVFDRRAAVELAAVRLLLGRLGEVRVQRNAEAAGKLRRLAHQLLRDRERRARSDSDVETVPGQALSLLEDRVEVLDERIRRQSAFRLAEVH